MEKVHISASSEYDVIIGENLLNSAPELIKDCFGERKTAVLSGEKVTSLYTEKLQKSMENSGLECFAMEYAGDESSKNLDTLAMILNEMADMELSRDSILVALGGGVTGDLGGLAAALYQRGIPFVQMPTTLLAMVDSSVGGKTAVNLNSGKNLAGVFKQPDLVICDVESLNTLPERYINEGMAEVIKYSVLTGEDIHLIESMEKMVSRCIEIKAEYVEADELDRGVRHHLNFGHTVGHAVERLSGFSLLHGEAVAVGMSVITKGCCRLGYCESDAENRLLQALEMFSLQSSCCYSTEQILEQTRLDKKRLGDRITVIIPRAFGDCEALEMDYGELGRIIEAGNSYQ